jgi:hypothetical protein
LGDEVDYGHERLYDRLTLEERSMLRDFEAWCWGSQDVSEEDLRSHQETMTPQAWARIQPVMQVRLEASRERQRAAQERIALLDKIEDWLRELRKLLEP